MVIMARISKWGFGMAPLKTTTEARYRLAVLQMQRLLDGSLAWPAVDVEVLSEFKGLLNRRVKQDQWDWFTVYTRFGEPDPWTLKSAAQSVTQLRVAVKQADAELVEHLRWRLIDLDV
jgi:hypothetical protein